MNVVCDMVFQMSVFYRPSWATACGLFMNILYFFGYFVQYLVIYERLFWYFLCESRKSSICVTIFDHATNNLSMTSRHKEKMVFKRTRPEKMPTASHINACITSFKMDRFLRRKVHCPNNYYQQIFDLTFFVKKVILYWVAENPMIYRHFLQLFPRLFLWINEPFLRRNRKLFHSFFAFKLQKSFQSQLCKSFSKSIFSGEFLKVCENYGKTLLYFLIMLIACVLIHWIRCI